MKVIFLILSAIIVVDFSTCFAGERDVYNFSWLDPDKEVYVLQNRKFRKKGRFHLNAGLGMTTSGAFVDATALQARFGFFPYEEWGFEFLYSKNSGEENTAAKSVRNEGGPGTIPFRRITEDYIGGLLLWSPFYMKINTFNTILYVDWILGAGYGKLKEINNREEIINSTSFEYTTETHGGILWATALKFYLNQTFSVRMDLTAFHYEATQIDETTKVWTSNFDLGLSLGLNF